MKIYTKRGDSGKTDLANGERVDKNDVRVESYGTIDELNSAIGMVSMRKYEDVESYLNEVQNHLHIIQAQLACVEEGRVEITSEHIRLVENWIDDCERELEPLHSFILPGGSEDGAKLHNARAVCRRAERRVVALVKEGNEVGLCLKYLNRLSDAMFVFARLINQREGVEERNPGY
tara:strand:+ start:1162 stop:1689 length:528 start_codon:yes stop_codon:yes gene_type:complete